MRKVMVDQAEVKNALRSGMKVYTISKKLDMPISVVKDIRDGKDRPFFSRKPIKDKNRFCTCCGFRENQKYFLNVKDF